ncbi:MAG: flavin reductase family protein [Myxococcales bacterium]|nr:flavin reductase family protein [Myxococcales bacterium]
MSADAESFKAVMGHWASGVSVVTTSDDGMLYGLTVSSFTSVSLDPPLILVCLSNHNRIIEMISNSGGFAVSMLGSDQQEVSNYFARPGRLPTPDFTEVEGQWTSSGLPVVGGSMAWLTCTVQAAIAQGDHTLMVGCVQETHVEQGRSPLLYFDRGYRSLQ